MTFLKRFLLVGLILSGGAAPSLAQLSHYQPLKPGDPLDLTLIDSEGEKRSLRDFRGRIVLINFWASWCPPCVGELPSLKNLGETFPRDEFIILAVSKDQKGKRDVAKKLFPPSTQDIMPLFFEDPDDETPALEVRGLPTAYILDREGRVVGRMQGATVWDHHEVQDLIQNYIDGKTPQPLSWWQRLKARIPFIGARKS